VRFRSRRAWNRAHADRVGLAIFLWRNTFLATKSLCRWRFFLGFELLFVRLQFNKTQIEIGKRSLGCCARDGRGRDTLGFYFSLVSGYWKSAGAIAKLHLPRDIGLLAIVLLKENWRQ